VRGLDSIEEVVRGVVDTRNDLSVTLGVCSPKDDDLVKTVGFFEGAIEVISIIRAAKNVI
jgi:hypothetical protein